MLLKIETKYKLSFFIFDKANIIRYTLDIRCYYVPNTKNAIKEALKFKLKNIYNVVM